MRTGSRQICLSPTGPYLYLGGTSWLTHSKLFLFRPAKQIFQRRGFDMGL